MPVGSCLGESSSSTSQMDVIVTSSVLNTADQFAFMQQTLLLQIFRTSHNTNLSAASPVNGGCRDERGPNDGKVTLSRGEIATAGGSFAFAKIA